ncbi:family 1 glycosylhydrolase [Cnuella takakiae]|nr:family 1 glycosylhydrolase [Cnuella takakiae]
MNHYKRFSDLEQIAGLGIKKIRYPVLWEKHQPATDTQIDWSWTASRLQYLKDAGIDVIAGLVHHGSGPAFTNMLDPQFPGLLADYARKVAERFPHLRYFTPVNEPLTTARFSGLYGLWYPHKTSDKDFIQMLLNECKATVLAMQAIRTLIPDAKLVQTEDLGKIYSTPLLQYQADFENQRRWLSYDLLCGRVDAEHPLWAYLMSLGIAATEFQFFTENPCVPDIFGFNHYVTSERYLDENLDIYPAHAHGGNGKHRYADVEAVRVELEQETGIKVLLKEAWERYGRPIAVTEVHLHCHREEQLRWFKYMWEACCELSIEGVNLQGVTAWAMLGSVGWNKLLTKPRGMYEPGVFDLRGGSPRPTALAAYIKSITSQQEEHHLAQEKGWWQRSTRFFNHTPVLSLQGENLTRKDSRPLMIIGRNGTLGKSFANACYLRSIPFILLGRQDCDITDMASVLKAFEIHKPWAVVNAAGYVRVDEAENDALRCYHANCAGAVNLATICREQGIGFMTFSSDLVFDGNKNKPYVESDVVNPLNVYGRTKAACEQAIQEVYPQALVIRTSAFFGPDDTENFVHYVIDSLSRQTQITVAEDVKVSPTYVPDLVNVSLDLLIDQEQGIRHLANKGAVTWAELAMETARMFRLNPMFINAQPAAAMNMEAARPRYSVLGSEKGILMPTLDDALRRFSQERKQQVQLRSIV